mmetsp:Transcript_38081/g.82795  ORF Transcript_38081/g.82795 Transcript_38081/m.82795 type:complete len:522 (+) Transcript_38081:611-2176(+)
MRHLALQALRVLVHCGEVLLALMVVGLLGLEAFGALLNLLLHRVQRRLQPLPLRLLLLHQRLLRREELLVPGDRLVQLRDVVLELLHMLHLLLEGGHVVVLLHEVHLQVGDLRPRLGVLLVLADQVLLADLELRLDGLHRVLHHVQRLVEGELLHLQLLPVAVALLQVGFGLRVPRPDRVQLLRHLLQLVRHIAVGLHAGVDDGLVLRHPLEGRLQLAPLLRKLLLGLGALLEALQQLLPQGLLAAFVDGVQLLLLLLLLLQAPLVLRHLPRRRLLQGVVLDHQPLEVVRVLRLERRDLRLLLLAHRSLVLRPLLGGVRLEAHHHVGELPGLRGLVLLVGRGHPLLALRHRALEHGGVLLRELLLHLPADVALHALLLHGPRLLLLCDVAVLLAQQGGELLLLLLELCLVHLLQLPEVLVGDVPQHLHLEVLRLLELPQLRLRGVLELRQLPLLCHEELPAVHADLQRFLRTDSQVAYRELLSPLQLIYLLFLSPFQLLYHLVLILHHCHHLPVLFRNLRV